MQAAQFVGRLIDGFLVWAGVSFGQAIRLEKALLHFLLTGKGKRANAS